MTTDRRFNYISQSIILSGFSNMTLNILYSYIFHYWQLWWCRKKICWMTFFCKENIRREHNCAKTQGMWREVRVLRRLSQVSWNWKFLVGSGTCYAGRAVWSILLKWSRPPRHLPPPWAGVPTPQSSGFPVNFGKKNKVAVPRPISFVFAFVFESFFLWVKYPKQLRNIYQLATLARFEIW